MKKLIFVFLALPLFVLADTIAPWNRFPPGALLMDAEAVTNTVKAVAVTIEADPTVPEATNAVMVAVESKYQPKGPYLVAETDPSVPAWAKEKYPPPASVLISDGGDYTTLTIRGDDANSSVKMNLNRGGGAVDPQVDVSFPLGSGIETIAYHSWINTQGFLKEAGNATAFYLGGSGGKEWSVSNLTGESVYMNTTGANLVLGSKNAGGTTRQYTIPTTASMATALKPYLTVETDPTVPAWAKAATKPIYTVSEIDGAAPLNSPVFSGIVKVDQGGSVDLRDGDETGAVIDQSGLTVWNWGGSPTHYEFSQMKYWDPYTQRYEVFSLQSDSENRIARVGDLSNYLTPAATNALVRTVNGTPPDASGNVAVQQASSGLDWDWTLKDVWNVPSLEDGKSYALTMDGPSFDLLYDINVAPSAEAKGVDIYLGGYTGQFSVSITGNATCVWSPKKTIETDDSDKVNHLVEIRPYPHREVGYLENVEWRWMIKTTSFVTE